MFHACTQTEQQASGQIVALFAGRFVIASTVMRNRFDDDKSLIAAGAVE